MRSHYCGQVDAKLIGASVQVAGWVHRRRDHGGVIFVDLRDREGLLQIVFQPELQALFAIAERLRNEFVIQVTRHGARAARGHGQCRACLRRASSSWPHELTLLNRSEPLPFQLDETVGEEVRLRYRYLDLRRELMSQRLRLRHRLTRAMRAYLDAQRLHRHRDADAHQGHARGGTRLPGAQPHPSRQILRTAAVARSSSSSC